MRNREQRHRYGDAGIGVTASAVGAHPAPPWLAADFGHRPFGPVAMNPNGVTIASAKRLRFARMSLRRTNDERPRRDNGHERAQSHQI
jgi:hypothetical protein